MTEEAKKIVKALRNNIRDGFYWIGNAEFSMPCTGMINLIESLTAQLEQVTSERDAAVKDLKDELKKHSIISMCEHCMYKPADDYIPNDCMDCVNSCNWQWRGVEVE